MVEAWRVEYGEFGYKEFPRRLREPRKQTIERREDWKNSKLRELLMKDLMSGFVPLNDSMEPK